MQHGCRFSNLSGHPLTQSLVHQTQDPGFAGITKPCNPSQMGTMIAPRLLAGRKHSSRVAVRTPTDQSWGHESAPDQSISLRFFPSLILSLLENVVQEELSSPVMAEHKTTNPMVLCFLAQNVDVDSLSAALEGNRNRLQQWR